MKKYTFKDGFKCVASSVEEAISKHKVMAKKEIKDAFFENIISYFGDKIKSIDIYTDGKNNILRFTSPVCKMLKASCYSFYIFFELSKRPDEDVVILRWRVEDYDEKMDYDFHWVVVNLTDAKVKIKSVLNAWDSSCKLLSKCSEEFRKFYKN